MQYSKVDGQLQQISIHTNAQFEYDLFCVLSSFTL